MAKAKVKAAPKKEITDTVDETITREEVKETKTEPEKAPPTPKASNVEKTESFTAAFKNDAHSAVDHFLKHNTDNPEEISREESDAGDAGVRVTLTYK
jgi:hypothetical protein